MIHLVILGVFSEWNQKPETRFAVSLIFQDAVVIMVSFY